ncbi:MAG: hypothetical protein QNJ77_08730 [Acidimicrobiia bacterium]|nr:hypothetical protein [Acidimicrobiia bacterium]
MTSWILAVVPLLNPEQRELAEGLATLIGSLDPPLLDVEESSAVADGNGFHVALVHANRPEMRVDIDADGHGEIVVSYGYEHEHFRSEDASVGRVWPFPSADHIQGVLTLVDYLMTDRIELHVWKRPLGVRTRSYWINDDGEAELFLRGGTVGPFLGWSRTPEIYRFDFIGTL